MTGPAQETLDGAMAPASFRIWQHSGCGGWVRFYVRGGICLRCHAGPLASGEYAKPRPAGVMTAGEGEAADRLMRGESAPGAPGACHRDGCAHSQPWHSPGNRRHPCEKCACPGYLRVAA